MLKFYWINSKIILHAGPSHCSFIECSSNFMRILFKNSGIIWRNEQYGLYLRYENTARELRPRRTKKPMGRIDHIGEYRRYSTSQANWETHQIYKKYRDKLVGQWRAPRESGRLYVTGGLQRSSRPQILSVGVSSFPLDVVLQSRRVSPVGFFLIMN